MAYFGIKFTCSSIVANAFDILHKLLLLPTQVDEEQKDFLGKSGYSFIQRKEKKRMTSKQTLFLVSQPHHCNIPSFNITRVLFQGYSKESHENKRKNQSYSLGICNRLLNFIRTRFTPVTLMGFKGMIFQCSFCRGLAALFDFIIQSLAGQAIKQVPLGPPVHNNSLQVPTSNMSYQNLESDTHEWSCDEGSQSARANFTDKNGNDLCLEGEKASEDVVATPTIGTEPTGPPKKTVSFNDQVQVMYPSKDKKKKKKKETKKLTSMEREMDEEPKPGKSILRMGSNLNGEQGKL